MTVQERPYMGLPSETAEDPPTDVDAVDRQVFDHPLQVQRVKDLQSEIRQLREQVAALQRMAIDAQEKALGRPRIKELSNAIRVLLLVMVSVPYDQDDADRYRRMLCGAEELAQRALLAAGASCRYPAARLAAEQALRAYHDFCGRVG